MRGSSRKATESVTFDTWGPPPPLMAGPGPQDLFESFVHQPTPQQVQCDGTDPYEIPWLASWGLYPQLYALGRTLAPSRILEIGTLYGHGMAAVLRGAAPYVERVDVIDAETYFAGGYLAKARENLQAMLAQVNRARVYRNAPPVRLTVWQWDTKDGLPFEDKPKPHQRDWFDLVLVDGDHSYDGKRRDLALAWNTLLPGGHLYVDDVHSMPHVRQAVQDFADAAGNVASVLELFTRTTDRPRGAYVLERGVR